MNGQNEGNKKKKAITQQSCRPQQQQQLPTALEMMTENFIDSIAVS